MTRLALAVIVLSGCWLNEPTGGSPPYACPAGTSYVVDTDASLSYAPGVDAGYYISYARGGHWHLEWTCDTKLSAYGCNFTGTVTAPTPPGGAGATCFDCEPAQDFLTVTEASGATTMQFDTITTSGIDGLDFATTAGSAIHVDLMVDGAYQNDLVLLPSGGRTATPSCMPTDLAPSAP
jgi:hypothetical protein